VKTPEPNGLDRRQAMIAGVGALATMMMQPGWVSAARAQAPALAADPRFPFLDRVSELTIPTTDTPGASAAGVPAFVLLALDSGMNGLTPAMLTTVRDRLDQDAGGAFLARPQADQFRFLAALDKAAYAAQPAAGTPEQAWRRIKAAIVAGYYSSESGATQELVFDPVPGSFENIALTPDFRSRSNDGFGGVW
jgi:hypothetical protein